MSLSAPELFEALRKLGYVQPAAVPRETPPEADDRPWFISLLLGASGWIAAVFTLFFLGLLFKPDSPPGFALTGALSLALAWGLYFAGREAGASAFTGQLALAFSLAGQCLVLMAFGDKLHDLTSWAALSLGLQLAMVGLMSDRLHRALSTLFAAISWAAAIRGVLFGDAWHGRGEVLPSLPALLAAWLFTWGTVGALVWVLLRTEPRWMASGHQKLARPVLTGLVVAAGFTTMVSAPFESFSFRREARAQHDWVALWPLLSALGALGGVAAGFALRSRALMGACTVAALATVWLFYYELGVGLLFKSALLTAMGALLLLAARALSRPAARKAGEAQP